MELRNVNGHIEVYFNNKFMFSCDTEAEALKEIRSE